MRARRKYLPFGKPEEVFQEEIIRDLYGITNGSFDPRFGSIELPGIKGEPEVLVISSGGSGIPVYRKLRKERIPFAAGILYENDIDCELARQLAVEVITEKAFEEISDEPCKCRENDRTMWKSDRCRGADRNV